MGRGHISHLLEDVGLCCLRSVYLLLNRPCDLLFYFNVGLSVQSTLFALNFQRTETTNFGEKGFLRRCQHNARGRVQVN